MRHGSESVHTNAALRTSSAESNGTNVLTLPTRKIFGVVMQAGRRMPTARNLRRPRQTSAQVDV